MQALFHVRHSAAAPLVLGLLLALTGCGGGGGGDGSSATDTASAGTSAASGSAGPASGLGVGGTSPGGTSTPSSSTSSGSGPGLTPSTTSEPAAGSSTPPSATAIAVRYTLGPVTVANATTVDFQNLEGMAATSDGGYRIVWMTATFDAAGAVQRAYFEQRYDGEGRRVGAETSIPAPTEDLSGSRAARVDALGGFLQFGLTDALRPGLRIQHFAADGTALDPPVELGGPSHGWSVARLPLASGAVAITWQPLSSVGPGELQTAVMVPGPR